MGKFPYQYDSSRKCNSNNNVSFELSPSIDHTPLVAIRIHHCPIPTCIDLLSICIHYFPCDLVSLIFLRIRIPLKV